MLRKQLSMIYSLALRDKPILLQGKLNVTLFIALQGLVLHSSHIKMVIGLEMVGSTAAPGLDKQTPSHSRRPARTQQTTLFSTCAPPNSFRYSLWPGRLDGCVCEPTRLSSRLGCAITSAKAGYPVFRLNSSSGQCSLCRPQNVSRYDPLAEASFFIRRSCVWSTFRGGLRMEDGIRPGQAFEIYGQVTAGADKFTVFWRPGPVHISSENLAIKTLISLSNQDGSQYIQLKSKVDGVPKSKKVLFRQPILTVGQNFRMIVLVTSREYVIYIKDEYCCSFEHVFTNLSAIHYLFDLESRKDHLTRADYRTFGEERVRGCKLFLSSRYVTKMTARRSRSPLQTARLTTFSITDCSADHILHYRLLG
ncbi:hypothetical protein RRG08_005575 [Elysia crispata]|uniref:Galectin domain-containing protein n=1 Tax=Elysia crispata TaxID=231223 RepID=A0AAE1B2D3_9GAST|nr:hypothetical protein RRG08_005575 [Elysia crispata]